MPMELMERIIKALLDHYDDICDHEYTLNSTRKAIQTLCLVHHRLKRVLYSSYWRQMCVSLQMQHRGHVSGSLPSLLWVARNLPESLPYLSIYKSPYIKSLPRGSGFSSAEPLMLNLNTRCLIYIDVGLVNFTCRENTWRNTPRIDRILQIRVARNLIERDVSAAPDLVGRSAIHIRFSIQARLSSIQQDPTRTRPVERIVFSHTYRLPTLGRLRFLREGVHTCEHVPFDGNGYINIVRCGPGRVVGKKFIHKTRYSGVTITRHDRYACECDEPFY